MYYLAIFGYDQNKRKKSLLFINEISHLQIIIRIYI